MAARKVKTARKVKAAAPKLDNFTRSYMETALWSSTDNSRDDGGDPLDKNYSIGDISDETTALMIEDCALFQERYVDLISKSGMDDEEVGHRFWLARNGHGVSFTDDETTETTEALQEAAESFGEFDLYVGDDGEIYGPPADWYRQHRTGGQAVAETRIVNDSKALLAARAKLAAVGMAIKKTDGEYRVYPKGNRDPDIGHFTDDLDDAVATGLDMAARGFGGKVGEGQFVADFPSVIDAIEAAQHDGATQVLLPSPENADTYVFFPDGQSFLKVKVFEKHGKWHVGARDTGHKVPFPRYSRPIGDAIFELHGKGGIVGENMVHDYIAVDPGGRVVGGPFKNYDSAKKSADEAGGYVQYTMNESVMNAARPRGTPQRDEPLGVDAIAWRDDPRRKGAVWYVDSVPGEGGADWGYSSSRQNAKLLSPYWQRRFRADMERVGSSARFQLPPSGARESSVVQAGRRMSPKKAGAKYAQDQLSGDYFMDWVRDQMAEAEEMRRRDPSSVMSLQTRNDYEKLARNMLQQIEWDTKRELDPRDAYSGIRTDDPKAFFEGFTEELKADKTVDWLADEIETIHKGSKGPAVEAFRPSKRHTENRKAAWMRAFQDAATALGAVGKLVWQDAEYLYSQGVDSLTAARRIYGPRSSKPGDLQAPRAPLALPPGPYRHRHRPASRAVSARRRGR